MSAIIKSLHAREIIDSRGVPTIEVEAYVEGVGSVRASVPSGKSTGKYEAAELRDKEPSRYEGKGVLTAVNNVKEVLNGHLAGFSVTLQHDADNAMIKLDGSPNKSNLGVNAILGISLAIARAAAQFHSLPLYKYLSSLRGHPSATLPIPAFNVLNGGSHAGNKLAIQEIMIIPVGANSFRHALQMGCEVYALLRRLIKEKYGMTAVNVGDEGGFALPFDNIYEALNILMQAIEQSGYLDGIKIGLDVAASEFYDEASQRYNFDYKLPRELQSSHNLYSGQDLIHLYDDLIERYPIFSIEDPFDQDDWTHFTALTKKYAPPTAQSPVYIIGDDLLVTNINRIQQAIAQQACTGLLCKVNQIGTVTEALSAVESVQNAGWIVMTSHRSGETEDHYIADIAVGWQTELIKSGAPCRSERLAKYNQLLRIEEDLGDKALYAGKQFSSK
jgi:enolase